MRRLKHTDIRQFEFSDEKILSKETEWSNIFGKVTN